MIPQKKVTNERAFECDISIFIPISVVTKSHPLKNMSQSMGRLLRAGD
jgi:hypothetical protein